MPAAKQNFVNFLTIFYNLLIYKKKKKIKNKKNSKT